MQFTKRVFVLSVILFSSVIQSSYGMRLFDRFQITSDASVTNVTMEEAQHLLLLLQQRLDSGYINKNARLKFLLGRKPAVDVEEIKQELFNELGTGPSAQTASLEVIQAKIEEINLCTNGFLNNLLFAELIFAGVVHKQELEKIAFPKGYDVNIIYDESISPFAALSFLKEFITLTAEKNSSDQDLLRYLFKLCVRDNQPSLVSILLNYVIFNTDEIVSQGRIDGKAIPKECFDVIFKYYCDFNPKAC